MATAGDKSGRVDLIPGGFVVTWDVHGLEIRAPDRKNPPLRLTWSQLQELAGRAGVSVHPAGSPHAGATDRNDLADRGTEEALRTLELTAAATEKEIREAHRDLARIWDPDRLRRRGRLRTKARAKLKRINEAYQLLKDYRPTAGAGAPAAGDTEQRAAPPPFRQRSVGDETQVGPPPISQIRVPEDALGLLVVEGGILGFPILSETARVGRYDPVTGARPEIDLSQLDIHRSVSRRHARIVLEGGRFALSEESGVLNGTFINGRRLTPGESVPVQGGDKLGFGNITLVFKSPEKAGRRRF